MAEPKSYQEIIDYTWNLINDKRKIFAPLYSSYAQNLIKNNNYIRNAVKSIRTLDVDKYINVKLIDNVKQDKSQVEIDLRYGGRSIGTIKVKGSKIRLSIKPAANVFFPNGKKLVFLVDNDGKKKVKIVNWDSNEAKLFRKNFGNKPKAVNNEHYYESQWLTNLEKKTSEGKAIIQIQPIKYANCRIQFPSFISAKDAHKDIITISIKKNGKPAHGGGIDILATRKKGKNSYLSIIELKNEGDNPNEQPQDAIKQAIAYATFIDYILNDKYDDKAMLTAKNWLKIFKVKRNTNKPLTLFAIINTPIGKYNSTDFAGKTIDFPSGDKLKLHYIYFDKNKLENGMLTKNDIMTSL